MTTIAKTSTSYLALILALALSAVSPAFAADNKIVIQVSTDDPRTQTIAMNNAVNLQQHYGMDNVEIEIVAYGPGLGMLVASADMSARVESLALQNVTFSACLNTMKGIEKRTGSMPTLTDGVQTVPAGVAQIMELQQAGYSYVRP